MGHGSIMGHGSTWESGYDLILLLVPGINCKFVSCQVFSQVGHNEVKLGTYVHS